MWLLVVIAAAAAVRGEEQEVALRHVLKKLDFGDGRAPLGPHIVWFHLARCSSVRRPGRRAADADRTKGKFYKKKFASFFLIVSPDKNSERRK